MEWLTKWFDKDNLSHTADILSVIGFVITIIGFVVTLFVFVTIRNIRSFYVFQARVPDLLDKISEHSTRLVKYNKLYDKSKPDILLEIGQIEVTLKSLKKKVSKEIQASIGKTNKEIISYKSNPYQDQFWKIYVSLQQVKQEITYLQEDQKWESK
jgi:predicted PurR-regulated permease PerM